MRQRTAARLAPADSPPTEMRVGIGALVGVTFWTYIVVFGRNAVAQGFTGSFDEAR